MLLVLKQVPYVSQVVNDVLQTSHLLRLLCSLGMSLIDAPAPADVKSCYVVILDGRVIGRVNMDLAPSLANRLRMLKVLGLEEVHRQNKG